MWIMIQARSTSTRLPNKVMQKIGDKTIIEHVIHKCAQWGKTIVLIPSGDPLKAFLDTEGYNYFEGSETDVLQRYYRAAIQVKAEHICRITSDCPLLDMFILGYMTDAQKIGKFDFFTNLPCADGHDVEIMSFRALKWAHENAIDKYDREHVTTYIKLNKNDFEKAGFQYARYHVPYLPGWYPKLSVDTQEDLDRIREIYEKIHQ